MANAMDTLEVEIEYRLKNAVGTTVRSFRIIKGCNKLEVVTSYGLTYNFLSRLGKLFKTDKIELEPISENLGSCCCCSDIDHTILVSIHDYKLDEKTLKDFILEDIRLSIEDRVNGSKDWWPIKEEDKAYIEDIKSMFPDFEVMEVATKRSGANIVISWEKYKKQKKEKEIRDASGRA
jgi:hypothetical protein